MKDQAQPFDGREFCRTLTTLPGVYRMLGAGGEVLYVGKARSLKARVSNYFRSPDQLDPKVRAVVAQVAAVEVTVTRTEGEALLLESNLIKELKPRYNIVLRDDKSYPYVYLNDTDEFPRLAFHRGARSGKGRYFGPYPNAGAVRATLNLLQKLFQIRSCEDGVFRNRTRPCLQFQIGRCTAPCVGRVTPEDYRADVEQAVMFLDGRSEEVVRVLAERMERASTDLRFEVAALFRDRIRDLQRVRSHQIMSGATGDVDVVAAAMREGVGCVDVFFVRGGHSLGSKAFFPAHTADADPSALLGAFLPQYYLAAGADRPIPGEIIVSHDLEEHELLEAALAERAGRSVGLTSRVRGDRARWVELAVDNARVALEQRAAQGSDHARRMEALRQALERDEAIDRIECFDISHTRGESPVASCVVCGPEGPIKGEYRRFNIQDVAAGDDYAAIRQAVSRRYARVQREEGRLPDLILIDGGRGQVAQATAALAELQLDTLSVVGVSKGPSRRAGMETLIVADADSERKLPADSPALHLIQQIRDEAHRFAITGHRARRQKARTASPLEAIAGVGAKRRRELLRHFGGWQGLERAAVEDLHQVPGISRALAQRIYDAIHDG
ncbi:MAG: excinuclease ABC subunit UvrC [Gammaproteobacteria bacterium]